MHQNPAFLQWLMTDVPVNAAHLLQYNPYWRKRRVRKESCTIKTQHGGLQVPHMSCVTLLLTCFRVQLCFWKNSDGK